MILCPASPSASVSGPTMSDIALRIRQLRKIYASGVEALRGIDLEVPRGEFFALLGPNGAGKSTTIGIITSLVRKTSGRVEVFGRDLDRDPAGAKRCLGLVPQEFNFNQFEPVEEVVINQAGYYGIPRRVARRRAEQYLKQLDLWDKRRAETRSLSGGMKRRLMIARAMVHRPRVLILDEPTAGVDIEIRRSMWAFMQQLNADGTTIILTTHYLEEAEQLCRRIAIIDHGRIVEDTTIKALLAKLEKETYVLDLLEPVTRVPELGDFTVRLIDSRTLEVDISHREALNDLFCHLNERGIRVLSLRNKYNRLEQLFVNLVQNNRAERAA